MAIPEFNEKFHTGLAQPIENQIGYHDELVGTIIDSSYWTKEKENIFQIIDQKTGEIDKEFYGNNHKIIYQEIERYKRVISNVGIIGYISTN